MNKAFTNSVHLLNDYYKGGNAKSSKGTLRIKTKGKGLRVKLALEID